mmetsp:Transcript_39773/g.112852  ORF Transcript_39773/g.112852 Transcript_39773/m.112852 type:complete len:221 (+) Transcript_39773:946-1608(+)
MLPQPLAALPCSLSIALCRLLIGRTHLALLSSAGGLHSCPLPSARPFRRAWQTSRALQRRWTCGTFSWMPSSSATEPRMCSAGDTTRRELLLLPWVPRLPTCHCLPREEILPGRRHHRCWPHIPLRKAAQMRSSTAILSRERQPNRWVRQPGSLQISELPLTLSSPAVTASFRAFRRSGTPCLPGYRPPPLSWRRLAASWSLYVTRWRGRRRPSRPCSVR